jgi:glycosyltransferase involved in cell wall biosynthesis
MKIADMKISVIVPNYNHARYLRARLDSIYNQTRMPDEVILLDDASTDDSLCILEEYSERFQALLLVNPDNSGSPFLQWKKGFDHSSGDLIWIAESDDVAELDLLQQLESYFCTVEKLGLAYCRSQVFDSQSQIIARKTLPADNCFDQSFICEGKEYVSNYHFYYSNIPNASAVLYRREALDFALNSSEVLTKFKLCGDWLVSLKILSRWRIAYCAKTLNYFRIPESSTRRSWAKSHLDVIWEWIAVLTYIRGTYQISPDQIKQQGRYLAQLWIETSLRYIVSSYDSVSLKVSKLLQLLFLVLSFEKLLILRVFEIATRLLVKKVLKL